MPWYRNQDQPQYFYVAEICQHLNPTSDFPGMFSIIISASLCVKVCQMTVTYAGVYRDVHNFVNCIFNLVSFGGVEIIRLFC